MSIKLHLATTSRDTERGLAINPGTGTPHRDVTVPSQNTETATAKNEDVGDIEKDEDAIKADQAGKTKLTGTFKL
ncbi:MAG: hypothetical protein ACOH13_08065 [Flavobacteriales bacterium]